MVGFCDRYASLDIRTVPLCIEHGYEIAKVYKRRLMAEDLLTRDVQATRRIEVYQQDRGNRTGAVVYYCRIGDYIKIGYSTRLRNRFTTLRADELLACEPGGPDLERQRHEEFTEERIHPRRENFRPSDRLNAHIELVRAEHGLPQWAALPDTTTVTVRQIGEPK